MSRVWTKPSTLALLAVLTLAGTLTAYVLWAAAPTLSNPDVDPDEGETGFTVFTWSVDYSDTDGDAVDVAEVHVRLSGDTTYTSYALSDPDTDNTWEYSGTLGASGSYEYRFYVLDDGAVSGTAESTTTAWYSGPDVNARPDPPTDLHMWPEPGTGTGIVAGTVNTTFTFFATMPDDPDGDDVDLTLYVEQGATTISKAMTGVVSADPGLGYEYYATVDQVNDGTFGTGTWTWYVEAEDDGTPALYRTGMAVEWHARHYSG